MEPQQSPANPVLAAARREKPKQGNKAVAKPKHAGSKNAGTKRHPLNRRPEELGAKRRASKGDGPDPGRHPSRLARYARSRLRMTELVTP